MNPKIKKQIIAYKETHEDQAIMALWEDFQPLVITSMRKFYVSPSQREDTRQDAFIQLLECANAYDITQGVPFESYFKMHLHYWFLNQIRKKKELLVVDHGWEAGVSMTDLIESTMGNAQEFVEKNENKLALEKALDQLTQKQRQVVVMYYFKRLPLKEIAKEMGCSYKVACKHKGAAIKNIQKAWAGN